MITKLATFRGISPAGEPLVRLFEPGMSLVKTAGEVMPQIKQWQSQYKPNQDKIAVLVSAMGASEYWGQNVNGDVFPENALIHDCNLHKDSAHPYDDFTGKIIPPYGYTTFLEAHPFVHHRNKDPNRAFGNVPLSVWNPMMHRVELVVLIDKPLALQHGAQGVVDRIAAGEYPDVSMGCRVPYDVCTICGNKSRTRKDYCSCVNEIGLGKILDDGRRIGVINFHPRFFDISFVFIGADKTAKVMCKLGSAQVPQSITDADTVYGEQTTGGLMKAASASWTPEEEFASEPRKRVAVKPGKLDPAADADERLMFGKTDNQGDPASIGDGIVRTNASEYDDDDVAVERGGGVNLMKNSSERARIHAYYKKGGLKDLFAKAKLVKIGPPPSPNRKEYPYVGSMDFNGLTLFIENKAGDVRSGTDSNGKKWRTEMRCHYGEIAGTKGSDKDKLDVFVGPNRNAKNVYIVHQNFVTGPKEGNYDEDKVMLGFDDPEQARLAYLANYNSPKFYRSMTVMAFPLFRRAISGKENYGTKMASAWRQAVADAVLEDAFDAPTAELEQEKTAESLEYYFSTAPVAGRRERAWRDKVTGQETKVTGSGMTNDQVKQASASKRAEIIQHGWLPSQLLKVSNETKAASHLKWADIVKEIGPDRAVGRSSALLSSAEPELPKEVLNDLGSNPDLAQSLATPSLMGMALKPGEFQRIILVHIGKEPLADKLDEAGATFCQEDGQEGAAPCCPLEPTHLDGSLLESLLPFLSQKSYLGPVVQQRLQQAAGQEQKSDSNSNPSLQKTAQRVEVKSPLLSKVASAYTWYRKEMMKLARSIPSVVSSNPDLQSKVLGISEEDIFGKMANEGQLPLDKRSIMVLLGSVPLSLMYSAHKNGESDRGVDVGILGQLVAEHPWLTSMGVVSGLGAILRDPRAQQAVDEAFEAGSRIWAGKQMPGAKS